MAEAKQVFGSTTTSDVFSDEQADDWGLATRFRADSDTITGRASAWCRSIRHNGRGSEQRSGSIEPFRSGKRNSLEWGVPMPTVMPKQRRDETASVRPNVLAGEARELLELWLRGSRDGREWCANSQLSMPRARSAQR